METDLIGTTEAADICGVDRATFFKWVQQGRIYAAAKLGPNTSPLVFHRSHVEALRDEVERRRKFKACPDCQVPTWGPCEHSEAAS